MMCELCHTQYRVTWTTRTKCDTQHGTEVTTAAAAVAVEQQRYSTPSPLAWFAANGRLLLQGIVPCVRGCNAACPVVHDVNGHVLAGRRCP